MITYSLRIVETNRKLHISVEFPLRKPPGNGDSLGLRTAETCGNFRFLHWNPAETNSFHKFTQGFQNVYAAWKLVFSSSECNIEQENSIVYEMELTLEQSHHVVFWMKRYSKHFSVELQDIRD